jgi:hypothetical protein
MPVYVIPSASSIELPWQHHRCRETALNVLLPAAFRLAALTGSPSQAYGLTRWRTHISGIEICFRARHLLAIFFPKKLILQKYRTWPQPLYGVDIHTPDHKVLNVEWRDDGKTEILSYQRGHWEKVICETAATTA